MVSARESVPDAPARQAPDALICSMAGFPREFRNLKPELRRAAFLRVAGLPEEGLLSRDRAAAGRRQARQIQ